MAAIKIPLEQAPGLIADSAHSVLAAHGYTIARYNHDGTATPITPHELAAAFVEIGRNASQALTSIDLLADAPTVTLREGDASYHGGPGWYYTIDELEDEGSCGPFKTREIAESRARIDGYEVSRVVTQIAARAERYQSERVVAARQARADLEARTPVGKCSSCGCDVSDGELTCFRCPLPISGAV